MKMSRIRKVLLPSGKLALGLVFALLLATGSGADPLATGGDVAYVRQSGVYYRVHIFRESGTFELSDNAEVEYALVAGGGGGGSFDAGVTRCPGGGGAGGVLTGVVALASGSYPVVVGTGGNGGFERAKGLDGSDTTAFGLTAVGGGGGATHAYVGGSGGSGGVGSARKV